MYRLIFLLLVSSCAVHDFRSNSLFDDIYNVPKIKLLDPVANSLIRDDIIAFHIQLYHPAGIKQAVISYADQKNNYSYNNHQYPVTVTINERLRISNSGPAIVSVEAVSGKNTQLATNITYNVQITSTYITFVYRAVGTLPIVDLDVAFLPTSAPPSRIMVVGPLGTIEMKAPTGGFAPTITISNLQLNVGVNRFTIAVTSTYRRVTRYEFTVIYR